MTKGTKILVPLDFSDCSEKALRYALMLAEIMDARVDVLHVWEPSTHLPLHTKLSTDSQSAAQTLGDMVRSKAKSRLSQFLADLHLEIEAIEARVEIGEPDEIILTLAEEDGYDMIVLGALGESSFSEELVGSVAERVLRRAQCPVLTVGASSVEHQAQAAKAAGF